MYIQRLKLENFRGARNLQLDLDRHLNIFVGMNGSGKSTLLDATALLLSWLANRIEREKASGRPISELDICNGKSTASLGLRCENRWGEFEWTLSKTRKGHSKSATSSLAELSNVVRDIQEDLTEVNEKAYLPLFIYYPVNRAVVDIPLRIRSKHTFDQLSAYDDALTSGANFRTFFEWFREREDLENETLRETGELRTDLQLQAVRDALLQFMPAFTDLTVRRSPLRMVVKKHGEELAVNQLSDGEKILMAMIGDLARRLAIANPMRTNPLEGYGIVLVDEIDLHLHPKWQRMIVSQLHDVFPNCQFLISTHSPHVITHVQPENLFLLSLERQELTAVRPTESYGKTVERVLEDLMGLDTTRPDDVTHDLRQLFDSIDKGELDEAKHAVERLRRRIGDDPELVKASVLITRKELIGK
ncbi:AAA family ATPase [Desulfovibrio inopinatus]|uniref:AAA family ATPase n=1 Tax=Desulfovibrio inopinatus TaxID=102109 RepID=UPI000403C175|nr:AAA family ATPase [Desulfovibrio inopinatus]